MDFPKDPVEALCQLPQAILDWHEADIIREQWRQGLDPDYGYFWNSLTRSQQWQLVAMLLDLSLPKDMPCPKVTLTKRAASLRTTALRSQNEGLKNPDLDYIPSQAPSDDETEKVKQIMLTWQNVRLIGMKGSGKTSKARWICQNRLSQGHKIHWINPHLSAHDSQLLKALGVNIVGGGRDYDAIAEFCKQWVMGENSKLTESYDRYASEIGAKFQPITFVVDELTNYKELVGEPIEVFIKASIQEFSKINWSTVYVTHNDTLACMACPSGFSDAIRDNLFDLRTEADPLQGNRIPKAIGRYRMPSEHKWTDVRIPVEWQ